MTTENSLERACPRCAETIKVKALQCRFCGLDIAEFQAAEVTKQRRAANRKRNLQLGQDLIDQALFDYAERQLNLTVGPESLQLLRGQALDYIPARTALDVHIDRVEYEAGKPLADSVDVSIERLVKRAESLGMKPVDLRESVPQRATPNAAPVSSKTGGRALYWIVIVGLSLSVVACFQLMPKAKSAAEKDLTNYCTHIGRTC